MFSKPPKTVYWMCAAPLALGLGACSPLLKTEGADAARNALTVLRADPRLAPQVQPALADAERSVQAAEVPTRDAIAGQHAVHVAARQIAIARFDAERKLSEAELRQLEQQRAGILADSQAQELEIARMQAEASAAASRLAQVQAAQARVESAALRAELDAMQANLTERGPIMTLGEGLFATGKAELLPSAMERLDQLAAFMHRYINRSVVIEGHIDAAVADAGSRLWSEQRAEAVKVYLLIQNVDAARIAIRTRGSEAPVADNATAEGRQQNRRVEIVIVGTGPKS